jgi:hypothetical protein
MGGIRCLVVVAPTKMIPPTDQPPLRCADGKCSSLVWAVAENIGGSLQPMLSGAMHSEWIFSELVVNQCEVFADS